MCLDDSASDICSPLLILQSFPISDYATIYNDKPVKSQDCDYSCFLSTINRYVEIFSALLTQPVSDHNPRKVVKTGH